MFLEIGKYYCAKVLLKHNFIFKLCASGFVCHLAVKYILKPYIIKNHDRQNIGHDHLKINRLLTFGQFGLPANPCICNFDYYNCQNLNCNFGKVRYILNLINNAEHSVDLCIYMITAKLFGDAIINAYKRGVRVRVITDQEMCLLSDSRINDFRFYEIPVRQKVSSFLMHSKFVIIDDQIVIHGSMNFTMKAAFGNWETVMISSCPTLVHQFMDAFQNLWDDFKPGNNPINLTC